MDSCSEGTARPFGYPYPDSETRRVAAFDTHTSTLARRSTAKGLVVGALTLPGMPDDDALRVHAAIPDHYRRPPRLGRWLAIVEAHPDVVKLRPEGRAAALALAWALSRYTDRRSMTARPGWALLAPASGLDRRRLARWLAWMREHQLIAHVEQGSTEQYRKGPADGAGNRAAVYVLIEPELPHRTVTPSLPSEKDLPFARATPDLSTPPAALRAAGSQENDTPWPAMAVTHSRRDRLAAAEAMQAANPVAALVSTRQLRSIARPWLAAGWCVRDLLHALDYRPDGAAHGYAYQLADLRCPPGWIAYRWRFWTDSDGHPLPSPRAQRQHEAGELRQQLERQRTVDAQHRPPTAPRPAPEPSAPSPTPRHLAATDRDLLARLRVERRNREQNRLDQALQEPPPIDTAALDRAHSDDLRRRAIARARAERSTRQRR